MTPGEQLYAFFVEPLTLGFMQRSTLAVVLIGIVCGVVGAFVVTRGLAFLGDALAHTILPGVAVAFLATGGSTQWVLVGGAAAGILSAVGIHVLTRGGKLKEDTAIGVVFAGALALGIAIISRAQNFRTDISHLLIGNVLAVSNLDLLLIVLVGAIILLILVLFYKEFLIVSFDPTLAQTLHLPGERLSLLLLICLALTVVISLQAIGVTLVAALLVTPAATARLFVQRMHHLMIGGAVIAAAAGVIGMYVSWHAAIAPSAAIVLTLTAAFALSFAWTQRSRVRRAA